MPSNNPLSTEQNNILNFINNLFKSFNSIFDGYDASNGKVVNKAGQVSCSFVLNPSSNLGNNTAIKVTLTATNVGSACSGYLKTISNLSYDNLKSDKKFINDFMKLTSGEFYTKLKDEPNNQNSELHGDISLKAIVSAGKGILGYDLENKQNPPKKMILDKAFQYWYELATKQLKFTIQCDADNCDAGTATNQPLLKCPNWVFKYIDFMNGKAEDEVEQTSKDIDDLQPIEAKYGPDSNVQANQITAITMVLPILITIQKGLRKQYQEELDTEPSLAQLDNKEELEEEAQDDEHMLDSAKQIKVTLKKIQGSSDIDMLALKSNYGPTETLEDLDEIVYQDEFMNTLSEEPQTFSIDVDDDGYDIEPCEACKIDPCDSLGKVLTCGITMYRNLYILHWMAKGNDMMKLHVLTEDLYSELIQEIDTLGELLVEKCGTVQNLDFEWTPIAVRNYEFQESLIILKDFIQNYIDTIDYAYPNQTSDVQSTLDEWLRYWNKQMNYFIKNQEM